MRRESNPLLAISDRRCIANLQRCIILPHRWGLLIRRGLSRRHTTMKKKLTRACLRVAEDSNL